MPWRPIQSRLRKKLGFWIPNGLRHTGAINFREVYGDGATADLLTHSNVKLVEKFYTWHTTRKNAEAFYVIAPESIPRKPEKTFIRQSKIDWPADDVLVALLELKPAYRVARELG